MDTSHFDPESQDVTGFIRSCVERAGGVVEGGPEGVMNALLPPVLEAAAGGRSLARLALAAEAPGHDAEPAMLGSPFMDALIAFASRHGNVGSGYLPAGRLKRRGLREEVEGTLLFSGCRTRYEYDEADVMLSATAQFDFKVALVSEERRERLYVIPVNLFSNVVHPALGERLAGLVVDAEAAMALPEAPSVPVDAAYETACRHLRRLVAEEAARQQVRVAQRFAIEFGRIDEYYGRVIADLERRRTRALGRSASEATDPDGSPGAAGAIAGKMESAARERERKLRELGETYGMRVRARLCSARCLWQPKAFFRVLIDRGPTTRTLVLAHDGLLERLELPTCDSCGLETNRLCASSSAQLLCPACARQ